ncbi:MAG: DNA recombination protein RmuC [Candidatus Omnitrophica bacterium]|nr:DNA recombination protein RmuC [Candidatus Omnitrophota bacterium]
MNALGVWVIVAIFGIVFLIVQLAFHFSKHVKMISGDVSEQLKLINDNLRSHFVDSSKLIQDANQHMGTRLDNAARVVSDVKEHLGRLEESSRRLYEIGKDISSLQDLLRSPKIRGGIGEYILEDLLSQILPKQYYSLQHEFKSKEKVDAVIRLSGGMVPVDAKFPLENFRRMLDSKEDKERSALRKLFTTDIKNHIKKISEKYILPGEGTFDFALMYIPAENVYYETIIKDEKVEGDTGIFQYSSSKKVIPVSPASFYAYLMVIVMGLKGMVIEKRAKDIMTDLTRMRGEFDKFSDDFVKVGRHIDNAKTAHIDSEKHLIKISDRLSSMELPETARDSMKTIEHTG